MGGDRTDRARCPYPQEHPLPDLARARPPIRAGLAALTAFGLVLGLAQSASSKPAESQAHRAARLRHQASLVRATIGRMNTGIEVVVERYDLNQEALARTRAAQAETGSAVTVAERHLAARRDQFGRRAWAIYTGAGSPLASIADVLGSSTIEEAAVRAKYQQGVVDADLEALAGLEATRRQLDGLGVRLADQRREGEAIKARLGDQRADIEGQIAGQRAYLAKLTAGVRAALREQRRRGRLRIREAARRLAAARARQAAAARARQAAAGRARAAEARRQRASRAARTRPVGGTGAASWPPRGGPGVPRPAPAVGGAAARAVSFALAQVGKPYRWGTSGPGSYDCSGLTMAAYQSAGIALPRISRAQWAAGSHVGTADLRPGDLMFYGYAAGNPDSIHHVALYVGRGLVVEAPYTGANVRLNSYQRRDFIGATRPTG